MAGQREARPGALDPGPGGSEIPAEHSTPGSGEAVSEAPSEQGSVAGILVCLAMS